MKETVTLVNGVLVQGTPKSKNSTRTVPIPPPVARMLAAHITAHALAPDAYVFGNEDGTPYDHSSFYRYRYRPAAERAKLGAVRFHDLRHTYASLMAAQGVALVKVSRWMGHSTVALTADTYTHLFNTDDDALTPRLEAAFAAGQAVDNVVPLLTARRQDAG